MIHIISTLAVISSQHAALLHRRQLRPSCHLVSRRGNTPGPVCSVLLSPITSPAQAKRIVGTCEDWEAGALPFPPSSPSRSSVDHLPVPPRTRCATHTAMHARVQSMAQSRFERTAVLASFADKFGLSRGCSESDLTIHHSIEKWFYVCTTFVIRLRSSKRAHRQGVVGFHYTNRFGEPF